jgi:ABC-2 type transport system permease protein
MHEAREAAQDVKGKLDGLEGRHDVNAKKGVLAKRVLEAKEALVERSAPVLKELRDKLRQRQALISTLRFISPALVVQLALEDVAGSGMNRHHIFQDQVDAYHERFRAFFKTPVQTGVSLRSEDLDALPQFSFEEEPLSSMAARVAAGVGFLLLTVVLLLILAGPSLRRVGRLSR